MDEEVRVCDQCGGDMELPLFVLFHLNLDNPRLINFCCLDCLHIWLADNEEELLTEEDLARQAENAALAELRSHP